MWQMPSECFLVVSEKWLTYLKMMELYSGSERRTYSTFAPYNVTCKCPFTSSLGKAVSG